MNVLGLMSSWYDPAGAHWCGYIHPPTPTDDRWVADWHRHAEPGGPADLEHTAFADNLDELLVMLDDWPDRIVTMYRHHQAASAAPYN